MFGGCLAPGGLWICAVPRLPGRGLGSSPPVLHRPLWVVSGAAQRLFLPRWEILLQRRVGPKYLPDGPFLLLHQPNTHRCWSAPRPAPPGRTHPAPLQSAPQPRPGWLRGRRCLRVHPLLLPKGTGTLKAPEHNLDAGGLGDETDWSHRAAHGFFWICPVEVLDVDIADGVVHSFLVHGVPGVVADGHFFQGLLDGGIGGEGGNLSPGDHDVPYRSLSKSKRSAHEGLFQLVYVPDLLACRQYHAQFLFRVCPLFLRSGFYAHKVQDGVGGGIESQDDGVENKVEPAQWQGNDQRRALCRPECYGLGYELP